MTRYKYLKGIKSLLDAADKKIINEHSDNITQAKAKLSARVQYFTDRLQKLKSVENALLRVKD